MRYRIIGITYLLLRVIWLAEKLALRVVMWAKSTPRMRRLTVCTWHRATHLMKEWADMMQCSHSPKAQIKRGPPESWAIWNKRPSVGSTFPSTKFEKVDCDEDFTKSRAKMQERLDLRVFNVIFELHNPTDEHIQTMLHSHCSSWVAVLSSHTYVTQNSKEQKIPSSKQKSCLDFNRSSASSNASKNR